MPYCEAASRVMQIARLSAALTCNFEQAHLITLRFEDVEISERMKNNHLKALLKCIQRTRTNHGNPARYVMVPEYRADKTEIIAYHFITDMPYEWCVHIAEKWNGGEYSIDYVNVMRRESLPSFMFDPSSVKKGRHFYTASHNVSNMLSA